MMELRPIIIDNDGTILGGNMRYKALIELGYKEMPDNWVKKASELTDDEKQRFIIADNLQFGDWDYEMLANEWDNELLHDWGIEIPNYNNNENLNIGEDNYEEPNELETIIKIGDIIEIGQHRLLCGDCTNNEHVKKLMNYKKVDLLLTDPPYGVDYGEKTEYLNKHLNLCNFAKNSA